MKIKASVSTLLPILIALVFMLIGVIIFQQYITNQLYQSVSRISDMVCPTPLPGTATSSNQ